jgi:hypothetical protein
MDRATMTIEIKIATRTVARSRNLRGLLDYARNRSPVIIAAMTRTADGADVFVRFADHAHCRTTFADYSVAVAWFKARRSWGLHQNAVHEHTGGMGAADYTRFESDGL